MLEFIHQLLTWIHVPAGIGGLVLFVLPLLLTKGGRAHRRVGWAFVGCMGIASLAALGLSITRLLLTRESLRNTSPAEGLTLARATGPFFLACVGLLTLTALVHGVSVLRHKARTGPASRVELVLPVLLIVCCAAMIGIGVLTGNMLMFTLPPIGLALGMQQVWVLTRAPTERMWWWFQHMIAMFSGCIAALTAALVVNSTAVLSRVPLPGWVLWLAPSAIMVPILIVWMRVYRRRFSRQPQSK